MTTIPRTDKTINTGKSSLTPSQASFCQVKLHNIASREYKAPKKLSVSSQSQFDSWSDKRLLTEVNLIYFEYFEVKGGW